MAFASEHPLVYCEWLSDMLVFDELCKVVCVFCLKIQSAPHTNVGCVWENSRLIMNHCIFLRDQHRLTHNYMAVWRTGLGCSGVHSSVGTAVAVALYFLDKFRQLVLDMFDVQN